MTSATSKWEHLIEVEKIHPSIPGAAYPRCSADKRAGPPEDCGGAQGYRAVLHALRTREGSLYQELLDGWHGLYDPAVLDRAAVNEQLTECFPASPRNTALRMPAQDTGTTGPA
jgi:hypothetical protein